MLIYGKTSANAIAVTSYLAVDPKRRAGSAEIAEARGISRALAAKILTRLATAGLVSGQPGPGGGYRLARPPEEIRLWDIALLFEQTDPPTPCPFGHDGCEKEEPCPLHDRIAELQAAARRFLEETHLSAFSGKTADCAANRSGAG